MFSMDAMAETRSSAKAIMFTHGLEDIPGTGHARGEDDQIAFAKADRLAAIRRDDDFAFQ